MRDTPSEIVSEWIGKQKSGILSITAIAIAEIQRGILRLPQGKRREKLASNFNAFIESAFSGRILTFDEHAAYIYGDIASKREQAGFNTDSVDLMIAAIVKSNNGIIATRNTKDFKYCGIPIINPWLSH